MPELLAAPLERASCAIALLLVAGSAAAQPAAPAIATRSLAATCAACHGTEGRAAEGAAMPRLAGQPREALATSLRAFRDDSRAATVMQQIAKGYSDEEIAALAAYFAALR